MPPPRRPQPSEYDISTLLFTSCTINDPRAAPAATLLLYGGLSIGEANRLRWSDVDHRNGTITICGYHTTPSRNLRLTPWIARQLRAIVIRNQPLVFATPSATAPTLIDLFRLVLQKAKLGRFTWQDFATWSKRQSPGVRTSLATSE